MTCDIIHNDHNKSYSVNFTRFQLIQNLLVKIGLRMHTKIGKYIPPTTFISYIGFDFCTVRMIVLIPDAKIENAQKQIE